MIKSLFLSNNEIIKYPIVTDKATRLLENNKYSFIVNPKSDKFSIKSAIEELFGVTVLKINTSIDFALFFLILSSIPTSKLLFSWAASDVYKRKLQRRVR